MQSAVRGDVEGRKTEEMGLRHPYRMDLAGHHRRADQGRSFSISAKQIRCSDG